MYSVIGLKPDYNMKAYLETIVISHTTAAPAVSQTILEFTDEAAYNKFIEVFDGYEKGPTFEVYRTLLVLP